METSLAVGLADPGGKTSEPLADLAELVVLIGISLILIVKVVFRPITRSRLSVPVPEEIARDKPRATKASPRGRVQSRLRAGSRRGAGHYVAANLGGRSLEATMGNKDKGGKNTKTVAAKNLKEKRLDKKAKRTAADERRERSV